MFLSRLNFLLFQRDSYSKYVLSTLGDESSSQILSASLSLPGLRTASSSGADPRARRSSESAPRCFDKRV